MSTKGERSNQQYTLSLSVETGYLRIFRLKGDILDQVRGIGKTHHAVVRKPLFPKRLLELDGNRDPI